MWKDGSQLPLSHNQEIVGGKVLGHLGKDNNSTGEQEGKRKKNQKLSDVKKNCFQPKAELSSSGHGPCSHTRYHCSSLLWKTRLAGDNASWNREFEASLDILGCWASQKVFSEYVNTVPLSFTHTNEKVRQVSALILPYLFWKTSVESEWVTVPLPNHLLKKKKIEQIVLLYAEIKHCSLFLYSEETE